ncbi:MAG: adenylate kinase [Alphaproteobacteria bacterium]
MNIVLFGPPGCGKGTQAQLLKEKYGLIHLSTGEVLRHEQAMKTELGLESKRLMEKGLFVPDDLILEMVSNTLDRPECLVGVIFDGVPRTIYQAEALERILSGKKKSLDYVIEILIDDAVLEKRITGRFTCKGCGAGYNDFSKPTKEKGICDVCGSIEFVRRADDTAETVKQRLRMYYEQTRPLTEYYRKKGLYESVDGLLDVGEVAQVINSVIEKRKYT